MLHALEIHAFVVTIIGIASLLNTLTVSSLRPVAFILTISALLSTSHANCLRSCGPRSRCVNSKCQCLSNYAGENCSTLLRPVSPRLFDVPFTGGVFFYYRVRLSGSVSIMLDRYPSHVPHSFTPLPVLFVTHGNSTSEPPPLLSSAPEGADFRLHNWILDRGGVLMRKRYQSIVVTNAKAHDLLFLAVYQRPWLTQPSSPAPPIRVAIQIRECGPVRLRHGCGALRKLSQSDITGDVTVLALPVVLGTLALLTLTACTRAWIRVLWRPVRVASSGSALDRLSPSETDVMFPRFTFSKLQASELGADGETSCAVCLSGYEEGESLRRLRCGHSYHASCLDEWLETNASCPRCRKPARIPLSFPGRLIVLRSVMMRLMRNRTDSGSTNGSPSVLPV